MAVNAGTESPACTLLAGDHAPDRRGADVFVKASSRRKLSKVEPMFVFFMSCCFFQTDFQRGSASILSLIAWLPAAAAIARKREAHCS